MIECVLYYTALEPNDTALRASRRDLALGVFSGDGQPRLSLREGLGRRSRGRLRHARAGRSTRALTRPRFDEIARPVCEHRT